MAIVFTCDVIETGEITTQSWGDDCSHLCCPNCGGEHLHHDGVSERAGRVVISFWCEGCTVKPIELRIGQHKGNTEISWRYTTRPSEE